MRAAELVGLIFLAVSSLGATAQAESAYVQQAAGTGFANVPLFSPGAGGGNFSSRIPYAVATPVRPMSNLTASYIAGKYNHVAQIQAGSNDRSNVGIIGGVGNNVGVVQGSNDRSNLALIGTAGLNIGVIQPNNSAPVNMLVARVPNVGLVIIRR